MKRESYEKLENSLLIFYLGDSEQMPTSETKSLTSDNQKIEGTKKLCEMTKKLKESFANNNIDSLVVVLQKSWEIEKGLTNVISYPRTDEYYEKAIKAGARGKKLLGTGDFLFLFQKKKLKVQLEEY